MLVPQIIAGRVPDAHAVTRRLEGRSMGCAWSVVYLPANDIEDAALASGISAIFARIIAQMSTWEPDSTISQFNRAQAGSWLPLPADFALVMACALHVASISGGALDPTAGELVSLWGFGAADRYQQPGFTLPAATVIEAARQRCGWRRLQVDVHAMRLHQPGSVQLDLSAVAKGFAVDEVSRFLRSAGVVHHLVDVGGELRGAGMKSDGQPWWVDVQLPPDSPDVLPTRIALHGLSVATSGDYLQGFSVNGRRYSHCIDPRTGYPIDNGVCAVTVLHPECMLADAWSTALMVLGVERGLEVAEFEQLAVQWLVRTAGVVTQYDSSALRALSV